MSSSIIIVSSAVLFGCC